MTGKGEWPAVVSYPLFAVWMAVGCACFLVALVALDLAAAVEKQRQQQQRDAERLEGIFLETPAAVDGH